jgi:multidrug transporter EmrE-like cation transporter
MDSQLIAWLCTAIACLGFGCNFVPTKLTDIKDGQFFALWVTIGIFLVGLVQWFCKGCYEFEPIAMLGGALWATGNMMVPFIITNCGLGIGQLVWGSTNMLTGWATGAFGLLSAWGVKADVIANRPLNYVGVGLSIVALLIFTQMRPEEKAAKVATKSPEDPQAEQTDMAESLSGQQRSKGGFAAGLIVALICGVFFGSNFDPPTVLQHTAGYPDEASKYVFSHFTGILALNSLGFLGYRLIAKECHMGRNVILPGLVAGILWGIAQVCWFTANSILSFSVAFPIIVGVPGIIAAINGIVLFGENREPRNLRLLAVIVIFQAASLACIAVSHGS